MTQLVSGSVGAFLGSSLGVLLIGSIIAAVGPYTWQRADWIYKENFQRDRVLLDRQVSLIEEIDNETGMLTAAADTAISAVEKGTSIGQRNATVEAYNTQQAQWFAANSSQQAMIDFYFRDGRISEMLAEVIDATKELDQRVFLASVVPIDQNCASACAEARTASEAVKLQLRELNALALQQLWSSQERTPASIYWPF